MPSLMQFPRLCSQCGKRPSDVHIAVESQVSNLKTIASLAMGRRTKITTISYQVPLCNRCYRENRIMDGLGKLMKGIGWLMLASSIIIVFVDNSDSKLLKSVPFLVSLATRFKSTPFTMTFLGLFIIGIIVLVIGGLMGGVNVASTDGQTFRFYNKEFQEAFAELNPRLVKRPAALTDDGFD